MPRSILLGRPWPAPGEPLFTTEDTDYAIALAEEELDTCPACGMPKVWCRDPANQFAYDADESFCWATKRLVEHREGRWEAMAESQRASVQLSARFRNGHEPDLEAGLGLSPDDDAS